MEWSSTGFDVVKIWIWVQVVVPVEKAMAPLSSTLAWRIPGTGSLVGCRLWGHTESDMTEATEQQQFLSAVWLVAR